MPDNLLYRPVGYHSQINPALIAEIWWRKGKRRCYWNSSNKPQRSNPTKRARKLRKNYPCLANFWQGTSYGVYRRLGDWEKANVRVRFGSKVQVYTFSCNQKAKKCHDELVERMKIAIRKNQCKIEVM